VAYLMVLATAKLLTGTLGISVTLDDPERFAAAVVVPTSASWVYLLAITTYGLSGDLAARQSTYPARMFALPATTATLTFTPMLCGTVGMLLLWAATRAFALWPSDMGRVPYVWPGLLGASLLAWTQALTWMPYGLRGLRVVAFLFILCFIETIAFTALHFNASETIMFAITATPIPLAYVVARIAVARARRGVVPDWSRSVAWLGAAGAVVGSTDRPFASPEDAQLWFEWRRYGRALPLLVAILLPFELLLLWAAREAAGLIFTIIAGALVTPPFMASFVAATMGRSSADTSEGPGMTPFMATRPVADSALLAAKLKMAVRSTLAAWLIVFAVLPLALVLSDTWPTVVERWHKTIVFMGEPRAIVFVALVVVACMASTWKQLVQTLYIGLTGREWLIKGAVFGMLALLSVLGPVLDWIFTHGSVRAAIWNSIPLILATFVAAKMAAAGWVAVRLYRGRLVADRTLIVASVGWCVTVLALYAVFWWFMGTDLFPRYLLALIAILGVPLARVSAAPLAIAWNRHR
jgi:hypothetical protein